MTQQGSCIVVCLKPLCSDSKLFSFMCVLKHKEKWSVANDWIHQPSFIKQCPEQSLGWLLRDGKVWVIPTSLKRSGIMDFIAPTCWETPFIVWMLPEEPSQKKLSCMCSVHEWVYLLPSVEWSRLAIYHRPMEQEQLQLIKLFLCMELLGRECGTSFTRWRPGVPLSLTVAFGEGAHL